MANPSEKVTGSVTVPVTVLSRFIAAAKPCQNPGGCPRNSGAEFEVGGKSYCGQHVSVAIRAQRTMADYG